MNTGVNINVIIITQHAGTETLVQTSAQKEKHILKPRCFAFTAFINLRNETKRQTGDKNTWL